MIDERQDVTEIESDTAPAVEQQPQEPKPDSLSNREAVRQALREHRERQGEAPRDDVPAPKAGEQPSTGQVKAAIEDGAEPPAEFSAAEKKAWAEGDTKAVLAAYRRVHEKRTSYIQTMQHKEREISEREQKAKTWADLGDRIAPYLKAKGAEGETPDAAIMNAIALAEALRSQDPIKLKAELAKQGIDLDKAPGEKRSDDSEIRTLKETVNGLLEAQQRQVLGVVRQSFANAFQELASQKTRTGDPAFPDLLDESENGMQLARDIGSLTNDPRFAQGVMRRIPGATHTDLVREAYKYLGGRVSEGAVKVSQAEQQKHTERSRRAAASTPSRMVSRDESQSLKGKLSNRAALRRAIAEHREH